MVMWYGFSPEAWAEWCTANGFDPSDHTGTMAKIHEEPKLVCIKCEQPIVTFEIYVHLEPPPPIIAPKFLHGPCLLKHIEEHGEELNDPILCYIYRKKV